MLGTIFIKNISYCVKNISIFIRTDRR